MVIRRDIADLYGNDIGNCVFGAVHIELDMAFLREYLKTFEEDLGDTYFNSGLLLINAERYKSENIRERCISVIGRDRKYMYLDQDILNIVCKGKVAYLDARWNYLWHLPMSKGIENADGFAEYKSLYEDAWIVHYAGGRKPWKSPDAQYAGPFWHYARRTDFYEEIIYENNKTAALPEIKTKENIFESYLFPFDRVARGSNIILYGAGDVGGVFNKQLELTKWCNMIMWADKNGEALAKKGLPVSTPEKIRGLPYDYVVIAVKETEMARTIRKELAALGIKKKKIVWAQPERKN
jgi:lipopolysaccharide biosynthesis glycosyltransferase